MKLLLTAALLTLSALNANAQQQLDVLRGNNLETQSAGAGQQEPDSMVDLQRKVEESVSQKCNRDGCVVSVQTVNGNEIRLGGQAGTGNNANTGYGYGNGVAIITPGGYGYDDNKVTYNVSLQMVHANTKCKNLIPESIFRMVETYINAISEPDYVADVMRKQKAGEDVPVSEFLKYQFMTFASYIKPAQGTCEPITERGGR